MRLSTQNFNRYLIFAKSAARFDQNNQQERYMIYVYFYIHNTHVILQLTLVVKYIDVISQ